MNITYQFPDSLFKTTTIIDGVRETDDAIIVSGREQTAFSIDDWPLPYRSFVTSDVTSLSKMDKIHLIQAAVDYARKYGRGKVEFCFLITNGVLNYYTRTAERF